MQEQQHAALMLASETPALLGESPLWHPVAQQLFYVDIPGRALHCLSTRGATRQWALSDEPGCVAAVADGSVLLAQRNGLWRLDPLTDEYHQLTPPPYDAARQRFNDGKPDPRGRLWVGTLDDARRPEAALYCWSDGQFQRRAEGITTSNGLAWCPQGQLMYWADTKAHTIYRMSFDLETGALGEREVWARFAPRAEGQPLESYGGRPDGAAVDEEGCYWAAMYEGQQVLRLSPQGEVVQQVSLPVRCPTMVAFGGADLRTLYITTARDKRPADELAQQPWAGHVLSMRVSVPGLAASLVAL
ncbi:SMP-30/gluconolactonase/LRE family protein [Roseateles sp. BYS180W]|uniref:SMP-30/gluconolactonase/LRE family protein n=1 Tax=Roseateles rivi TaxID=3299028 RepID=A0ABW7FQZ3_9BURK